MTFIVFVIFYLFIFMFLSSDAAKLSTGKWHHNFLRHFLLKLTRQPGMSWTNREKGEIFVAKGRLFRENYEEN